MLSIDLNVVYNIINIIILFLLLKKFLFKPVTEIMEKRQQLIEASLKDAEDSKTQANDLKLQYENALKEAKEEAVSIVRDAKVKAEAEYERKMKDAANDARTVVENAEKTINIEREKAIRSAKSEIASLALAAASKVVEKETNDENNRKLLNDFLSEAGDLK